jgi:hypothetical protein
VTQLMAVVVMLSISIVPTLAQAQEALGPDAEAAAFKQLAAGIPLGARVKVQSRNGRRMTATLMSISDDAIVVKRESRVPEPAVRIPFTELTRLHLDEKSGFSIAKAVGVGLAAGVGAILTLFAIAVSVSD